MLLLMITSKPNLVMHSRIRLSHDPNCHHQIVLQKAISQLVLVWYYQQADTDLVK